MSTHQSRERLRKLMAYILAKRPDEFGLVPDDQGFVMVKELLKAITEEPGWGYVRKSHIQEVLTAPGGMSFLIEGDKIKAICGCAVVSPGQEAAPPALLYHCVRRRAYPLVCKEGVKPPAGRRIFLAATEALAVRMGKRRDPAPVLLTVQAGKASKAGIRFFEYGEHLYAADYIPAQFFKGPPLPRERKKEPQKRLEQPLVPREAFPGSVSFDLGRSEALFRPRWKERGAKREIGWKRDVRTWRRHNRRNESKRDKT